MAQRKAQAKAYHFWREVHMKWLVAAVVVLGASGAMGGASGYRSDPKIWNLAFLKGTAAQIHDQLNREVSLQLRRIRQFNEDISDFSGGASAERKACLSRVHSSREYRSLAVDFQQTTIDLKAARAEHSSDALRLSSRYNHLRAAMQKMEADAIGADASLADQEAKLSQARQGLEQAETLLKQSREWRDHVIGAIKNSYRIRFPLVQGDSGVVLNITASEIDRDEVTGIIETPSFQEEKVKEEEQITTSKVDVYQVKVHLFGIETGNLKLNKTDLIDRNFKVTHAELFGSSLIILLSPSPDPVDHLMQAIDDANEDVEAPASRPAN